MFTCKSVADLSAKKYYIAMNDADGLAALADAATKGLLGVIGDGGKVSGDEVSIWGPEDANEAKVILGGTIALSASLPIYLTADSAGKAVATTTSGDIVIGTARDEGVAGDVKRFFPMVPFRLQTT